MTRRASPITPHLAPNVVAVIAALLQGHLFKAAFVKKVPLFMQNLGENVALCFVASAIEATSRRCLTLIDLQWQKTLTARIHKHYFQNMVRLESPL